MGIQLSLTELLNGLKILEQKEGLKTTVFCVGPMSENIMRATLEAAKEDDFPAVFIASRNQVDAKELGGGYVLDCDAGKFCGLIHSIAEEVGFDGLTYVCRDHGGPWQRDNERGEKLSESEAMEKAKASYLADLEGGFNVLHIDPTVDPHYESYVPLKVVTARTVELIEFVEAERKKRAILPIGYEIGTEATRGGLTGAGPFEQFLTDILGRLSERGLPKPDFIVGQTGTLIKMCENVGTFSSEQAKELSRIAREHGVGFKEHNADFLDENLLKLHPELGITGANTGPEFSAIEAKAYLGLAAMEESIEKGEIENPSNFIEIFQNASLESGRWKKWLAEGDSGLSKEDLAIDKDKLREVTLVCGRYVHDDAWVKKAVKTLFGNLEKPGVVSDPEREIIDTIKQRIRVWAEALNLRGTTSKVMQKMGR